MMDFDEIRLLFNRALFLTFDKKKLSLSFIVLVLCGLLIVFFRGVGVGASDWVIMSLTFLPFFLCAGVLLSMGIFLIRVYHNEIKNKEVDYRSVLDKSWDVIIGASYFSIPLILSYLLLWICLGVFLLLRQVPALGELLAVILAFAPFILNLGSLILCLLNLCLLFFITPIIALRGLNRMRVTQMLVDRLKYDPFLNIIAFFLALLPLIFVGGVLVLAVLLTGQLCSGCDHPLEHVLQWFFIMIPFTAVLAPPLVFFFNFSAEVHASIQKHLAEK